MKYIEIDRLELIASIERPTVELTAGYIMDKVNPFIDKIKNKIIPFLKQLQTDLNDPEVIEIILDFSELAVALSTIRISPIISIIAALDVLNRIKDRVIISKNFPAFIKIMGMIEKLEKSLQNFKKAYIVLKTGKLPVNTKEKDLKDKEAQELREKQEKELKIKMENERKRQEQELKKDRLEYVDTF